MEPQVWAYGPLNRRRQLVAVRATESLNYFGKTDDYDEQVWPPLALES